MKKRVLLLSAALAVVSLSFGQGVNVTAPYAAGSGGYEWSGKDYQRGSVIDFEGTYDEKDATDSVEIALKMWDVSNWSTVAAMSEFTDGSDGQAIDGIIDDKLTVPTDYPLSADYEALAADWSSGHLIVLQTRVYYDTNVYESGNGKAGDIWANATVNIVEAYGDSVAVRNDSLYPEGIKVARGFTHYFDGHYGIDTAEYVEVSFRHMNSGWGDVSTAVTDYPYSSAEGHGNSGQYRGEITIPVDYATDAADDDIIAFRVFAKYKTGNKMIWFFPELVDATVMLDKETLTLAPGAKDTLTAKFDGPEVGWADNDTITFTSSDEFVVTIDEKGNIIAVGEGTATITATAALNGATATCAVTVEEETSTNKNIAQTANLYPNPVNAALTIDGLETGNYTIEVYNILGAQKMSIEISNASSATVSMDELPTGTYLIKVSGEQGTLVRKVNKL